MKTRVISINDASAAKIHATLQKGNIIAYPTDTIYGLGADIFNVEAVKKLFETKNRDYSKPVSLLYFSREKVLQDFAHLSEYEKQFITEFFPGAVTLVLRAKSEQQFPYPFIKKGKVGIRVIDHPKLNALFENYPNPITTTSINPAGAKPAESPAEILEYFPHHLSYIIDDGCTTNRIPSTVISLEPSGYSILREAAISKKEIQNRINK